MSRVLKLRILVTGFLLVSLVALAVPMAITPAADAVTDVQCAYTGLVTIDGADVPAGTAIQVLKQSDSTLLRETNTGAGELAANRYYADGVMAPGGTVVKFKIWDADTSAFVDANETAEQVQYAVVECDLTYDPDGAPPEELHININPFLFVYPWADCSLPDALTNVGPGTGNLDIVIVIWGTANLTAGWQWVSYAPASPYGDLGALGLEQGKPYIMHVEEGGVCNDWDQYQP